MAKINTSSWKSFIIGDLFPSIIKPPVLHSHDVIEDSKGMPYVVRTKFNNGIKCRVRKSDVFQPSPAGVITFGAENATFFYQEEAFVSGRDIYYIDTRSISPKACLFLTACLQPIAQKYSYNYGLFPDLIKKERVMLPVDIDGLPYWEYMDCRMNSIMNDAKKQIQHLLVIEKQKKSISIDNWKMFTLGGKDGLFNIVKGVRLTKHDMIDGNINFISASSFNNGIAAHIANDQNIHPGNTMTVSYNGSDIGRTFYQEEPFWASDDVNVFYPRFELNKYIALFLAPLIKAVGGNHFYKDKWLQEEMMSSSIPLPITPQGKPDWDYIEQFMKSIIEEAENGINTLTKAI